MHDKPSSDGEEDCNQQKRVPTLLPRQYNGTTPWKEFMSRFESCAKANHWSKKTTRQNKIPAGNIRTNIMKLLELVPEEGEDGLSC